MRRITSALIYLFLVLISAGLSILISIKLAQFFSMEKKVNDYLLVILFFVIYALLLFIWIKIDKNWNRKGGQKISVQSAVRESVIPTSIDLGKEASKVHQSKEK